MISIAMTTYNGSKYLREQLDSILNQTEKDFELVKNMGIKETGILVSCSDYHIFKKKCSFF